VKVCADVVGRILKEQHYSLQAPSKVVEGKRHPAREAQFEHIDATTKACIACGIPVVSVDTKKKALVGNFKNNGREWHGKGGPELTDIHDFPVQALGKAIPYGVYDVADNSGFVNVGIDHDTGAFAVASIEAWWNLMGKSRYPHAKEVFITADAGGSNGCRLRLWKLELQRFADAQGLVVHVGHYPPGTSKWNKIEHRLFSFISINWRGRPLRTYAAIVHLISSTQTKAGLVVTAQMDKRSFDSGIRVTDAQMKSINITKNEFQGDWNYTIRPRPEAKTRPSCLSAPPEYVLKLLGQVDDPKACAAALEDIVNYVTKNAYRLDYARYIKDGYQIGTGAMEWLHRVGSQVRVKRSGSGWRPEMSQVILNLRMTMFVEKWDVFWSQPGFTNQLETAFQKASCKMAA
jgi:hypothetical protein